MARKRDPLGLTPHWHADVRLEAELAEDNVVRTRFLVNALFGSATVAMFLVTSWLAYQDINIRRDIQASHQQLETSRPLIKDIPQMQREFLAEAKKIEQAAAMIKTPFPIAQLIDDLGRTKPDRVFIESIEWNEAGVFLRGNIRDTSANLASYVDTLKKDPAISPLFADIRAANISTGRGANEDLLNFDVRFTIRPTTP